MENNFNYAQALEELEKLAQISEDPATPIQDIDKVIARANELVKGCREYLRGAQEKLSTL